MRVESIGHLTHLLDAYHNGIRVAGDKCQYIIGGAGGSPRHSNGGDLAPPVPLAAKRFAFRDPVTDPGSVQFTFIYIILLMVFCDCVPAYTCVSIVLYLFIYGLLRCYLIIL